MVDSILVLNRYTYEHIVSGIVQDSSIEKTAVISVFSSGDIPPQCDKHIKNLLRLNFDDIDTPTMEVAILNPSNATSDIIKCHNITDDQANMVIKFLEEMHNSQQKRILIVHCDAGIARSGAIASFAQLYFSSMSSDDFAKTNDKIHPNLLTYNTLVKQYEQAKSLDS